MKKILLLLFLSLTICGFSQKIGNVYLPPKSTEMPAWFEVFYREGNLSQINVNQLDNQSKAYEKSLKKAAKQPVEEVLTGEENEDAYLNYYKRWRRAVENYVQEDGYIDENAMQRAASDVPPLPTPMSPTSTWNLVGPVETFWAASTAKAPWQVNIYAAAPAPSNPNTLYACPETGGIFKTTDKGLTWTPKTETYNINACTAIQVHPSNADIVYAGRSNQLIQSTDGGNTWAIQSMPTGGIQAIKFHPANPNQVFLATDYGLFKKVGANFVVNQGAAFNVNGLQSSSPTWNRNNTGTACVATAGTNQYYHVFPFTVSATGSYTFAMCTPSSNWDGFASLYQNAFDGTNPCATPANHLYSDNDANSGGNCANDPLITQNLVVGTTYYLVTTSAGIRTTGGFQWTFTGPAGASLTSINDSWIQVPNMAGTCTDIFFKTDDSNIVFCLKKVNGFTEFWRSTDGGVSFAASLTGWAGKGITADGGGRMTVTPADPNRLYAVLLGAAPSPTVPFLFRSNDAGLTWDTLCTGRGTGLIGSNVAPLGMSNGQGYYDLDILANPLNADQVIVATTSAYRSINGGMTFSAFGGYLGSFGIHPDIQEMVAIGGDTWITTDGGINYSTDFFGVVGNFSPRCKGIYASDFWGFAQGWNEDIVGGGRYHNGNTGMSEDYPLGEAIRLGGGEAPTGYYMVGRPRHITFSDIAPKILPTTRNGASGTFSFTKYPNEDGYGDDASEVEFLPYCYNTIYTGSGNELWKSTDGGITWTSLFTFAGRVKKFEISRSNPNVIYLATNTPTQIQKSTDGGATWSVLTLPTGASANRVSLALSFTDEHTLWITSPSNSAGNRIFKSINGGTSWTNLTTPTIDGQAYMNVITHQGTDNGIYVLGYDGKVFYKSDSEPDWVSFSANLPLVHDNYHVRPFFRDSKLRSAGNQGIWEVEFYEEGQPIAQPTVDKLTSLCPRDTFYFEDYSALNHTGATWAWTFPGASYVSSASARNPKVVYGSMGTFDFSLTVSNPQGSSSKSILGKISITGNECGVDTIPGKMLTLSAAGDYGQQTTPLNIVTNNITMSTWIKPNGIQMGNAGIIFSGSAGATGFNFRSNNQVGYHWAGGAGSYNWAGGPTLPANEWSHLAFVVKDGAGTSDTAWIYLNGVPYFRVAAHNPVDFNTIFQFGIDRSNTTRNFIGNMDEVCFYNRALSRNEIRELMNLTRNNPNASSLPQLDNSLIAYYQFNEGLTAPIYDKIGAKHATLVGNADKNQISTAPVGGGVFQRMAVTNGGIKNFATAGLSMTFPPTGTYPNGDLVVTRLHVPSDQACAAQILPNPAGYWIVRNYGTNSTFSSLSKLTFKEVLGTNNTIANNPHYAQLYKRASNQDGNTWGTMVDEADAVSNTNGVGDISFYTGLSLTGFSQFEIGASSGPLPVQLTHFFATLLEEQNALLTWNTSFEENLHGFDIEHSSNGNSFEKIGFVAAKGSGNYDFYHSKLKSGRHYYRLKILDTDGKYQYSPIEMIFISSDNSHSLYPNPSANGWFTFASERSSANTAHCVLNNALGQTVYRFQLENLQSSLTQHFYLPFASGIYTLIIHLDNGETLKKKVIIE